MVRHRGRLRRALGIGEFQGSISHMSRDKGAAAVRSWRMHPIFIGDKKWLTFQWVQLFRSTGPCNRRKISSRSTTGYVMDRGSSMTQSHRWTDGPLQIFGGASFEVHRAITREELEDNLEFVLRRKPFVVIRPVGLGPRKLMAILSLTCKVLIPGPLTRRSIARDLGRLKMSIPSRPFLRSSFLSRFDKDLAKWSSDKGA